METEIEKYLPLRYAKKREALSTSTPFICTNCGQRKANEVRRNGHYIRQQRVSEGVIEDLKVPMV